MRNVNLIGLTVVILGIGIGIGFAFPRSSPKTTIQVNENFRSACFTTEKSPELFTLDGKLFTFADLPSDLHSPFLHAQVDSYRRAAELIAQAASRVAAADGGEVKGFAEILGDQWISDKDVADFRRAQAGSFGPGQNDEQVVKAIRAHLEQQAIARFTQENVKKLRQANRLRSLLTVPCGPIVELDVEGLFLTQGKPEAPIRLVMFSDFMSPQARFHIGAVRELLTRHGDIFHVDEIVLPQEGSLVASQLAKTRYCLQKIFPDSVMVFAKGAYQLSTIHSSPTSDKSKPEAITSAIAQLVTSSGGEWNDTLTECMDDEAEAVLDRTRKAAKQAGVETAPAFFLRNRQMVLPGHQGFAEALEDVLLELANNDGEIATN